MTEQSRGMRKKGLKLSSDSADQATRKKPIPVFFYRGYGAARTEKRREMHVIPGEFGEEFFCDSQLR